jgi:manganese transport protein
MFHKILVALENSAADQSLLPEIVKLAKLCGAQLLLVHVADGWAARHYEDMKLRESEEMIKDRAYLDKTAAELRAQGVEAETCLALGEPPQEILKTAETRQCDLIAMTSHGHGVIGDFLFGSTISTVRHRSTIPLFIVKASNKNNTSKPTEI